MKKLLYPLKFPLIYPLMAVVFGLVGGCALYSGKPGTVMMQHPETMEFVTCKMDKWPTSASYAENEKCVEDLKQKGFVVWGEH